jgi:hypothetical protein
MASSSSLTILQWQYFVPIQERLPQNCSTDLVKTIDYIDSILTGPDESAKDALKKKFMLGDLRDDDFAAYVLYCMAVMIGF